MSSVRVRSTTGTVVDDNPLEFYLSDVLRSSSTIIPEFLADLVELLVEKDVITCTEAEELIPYRVKAGKSITIYKKGE